MSYISPGIDRALIIGDDADADDAIVSTPEGLSRGYEPRDWTAHPLGSFAPASDLPDIDPAEWPERIEAMDRQKRWPKDHKIRAGFESLDQNGTNYCWVNAPTQACHYIRVMQGLPHVALSPASVGAPIKRYRNVGGWGSTAIRYMAEHGLVPQSLWPANAIDDRYDSPESREARPDYIVDEWGELPERNFIKLVSTLLHGWPVAIGLNWWGHEVLACKLAIRGSDPLSDTLTDIDNSWGTRWGDNGHGLLTREKATPDDAVFPRAIIT